MRCCRAGLCKQDVMVLRCPAAVMSSNGETNVVLRGVTHGAVDFLIKPVRVEELRNVWQHVVRRKRDQVLDVRAAVNLPPSMHIVHVLICAWNASRMVNL